jgi:hypothetical protein
LAAALAGVFLGDWSRLRLVDACAIGDGGRAAQVDCGFLECEPRERRVGILTSGSVLERVRAIILASAQGGVEVGVVVHAGVGVGVLRLGREVRVVVDVGGSEFLAGGEELIDVGRGFAACRCWWEWRASRRWLRLSCHQRRN